MKKGPGTSCQSLFGLQNMYKRVSEFFQKLHMLIYAKQIHDVTIIPVLSDPLNLENVEREKIYKKLNLSRMKGTF